MKKETFKKIKVISLLFGFLFFTGTYLRGSIIYILFRTSTGLALLVMPLISESLLQIKIIKFLLLFIVIISRADQNQAAEYRDDLEPKFGQIEILLLGRARDSSALIQNDPPRLKVFGYEALVSTARTQLDWLLKGAE